eukprot:TRINITY_DN15555_c0_g1_i1.p1 TRINITY_DN15555_c0_g1~~TRINITY_DN15555_c0_g1_i1.p1  ORF type:complete len:165 (-),score=17.87 TRINITY_DN15555_c0_g1_i1:4-498(-)
MRAVQNCWGGVLFLVKLDYKTKVFLLFILFEFFAVAGFTIERIVTGGSSSDKHATIRELAIIFLLISIFWTYFGLSGVVNENTFELLSWVASAFLLLLYNLSVLLQRGVDLDKFFYMRFGLVSFTSVVNLFFAVIVYGNFGWRMYKKIGADIALQNIYLSLIHI